MAIFSFDAKSRLGIDIGTASIKIVELAKESNRFKLINYGVLEISPGETVRKLSNQEIVASIKEVLIKTDMKSLDVVASIPSFPTFTTVITMPYISEQEITKAMPFEARKYIPVPLSEVELDWAIVNVRKEQKHGIVTKDSQSQPTIDVFLVAVPKEEVMKYQNIMKSVGLNLKALELENFALIRSLIGNDLSPVAIVSVGERSTSVLIAENGFQRASHDYEIGGLAVTKSIAQSMNISMEKAEALKKNVGIKNTENDTVKNPISSLVDMMAFETNKTIHNYEDQWKTKITKVLLAGGMANMPHFSKYFSEKLGRPAAVGNPFARIITPPPLQPILPELSPSFVVSVGLAMRDI